MPIPQAYAPVSISEPEAAQRIIAQVNAPFWLAFHPRSVDVMDLDATFDGVPVKGSFWLPSPVNVAFVPGSRPGMRTLQAGEPPENAWIDCKQAMERDGYTWIPRDIAIDKAYIPPGISPDRPRYVVGYPCRELRTGRMGTHWTEIWNVPVESVPGEVQQWRFDRKLQAAWIASLVINGTLRPVVEHATLDQKKTRQGSIRRLEASPLPDGVRARRMDDAEKRAERLASPIFTPDLIKRAA